MYPPLYTPENSANPFSSPEDAKRQGLSARRKQLREEAAFAAEDAGIPPHITTVGWAEQWCMSQQLLSRKDLLAWLSAYCRAARMPHHSALNLASCVRISAERQNRREAAMAYNLAAQPSATEGPWRIWLRHEARSGNEALRTLCENLDLLAAEAPILKQNERSLMVHTRLDGREVIVKRHRAGSSQRQWKEGLLGSRGLKAWQAAHALEAAGIPTPRPVAALERREGRKVTESFYLYECLPDAQSARSWINPLLHRQPAATRHRVRRHLHAMLDALYAAGIYHPDTKTGNLLVQHAGDDARRAFYWIDLDGLRIRCRPGPYRVLRNLIQLNGSLGRKLERSERLLFLKELSTRYLWLRQRWVPHYIERSTRKRLWREVQRICGH